MNFSVSFNMSTTHPLNQTNTSLHPVHSCNIPFHYVIQLMIYIVANVQWKIKEHGTSYVVHR